MSASGLDRWRDRVALVTGASSGIGTAAAEALLAAGMRVAVTGRNAEPLEALRKSHGPDRVLCLPADLRDESQILSMFQAIRAAWGGVDVVVNNAGLGHAAPLMSGSTEHWRDMLEVNVLALCICSREALTDMRQRGDDGHVIHISSMAAHRVPPGSGLYSATKYAVRSLTEGLRRELREAGSGIRVTSVSPGFVETRFAERYHKSADKARETYSRYRVLDAADVAEAVLYVLGAPPHVQVHDLLMRPTDQPG